MSASLRWRRAAAVAAMVGAVCPPASLAAGQTLGRLFTTPEQRIELDEARERYPEGRPRSADRTGPEAGKPEAPAIPTLTVNGVVLRSSGNDASWVNGAPVLSGQTTPEGIRVELGRGAGTSVRLVLPSGSDTTLIKPGQKIDVEKGKVIEPYEEPAQKEGSGGLFAPKPEEGGVPAAPDVAAPPAPPGASRPAGS